MRIQYLPRLATAEMLLEAIIERFVLVPMDRLVLKEQRGVTALIPATALACFLNSVQIIGMGVIAAFP